MADVASHTFLKSHKNRFLILAVALNSKQILIVYVGKNISRDISREAICNVIFRQTNAAIILGDALFISITLQSLNILDIYDDFAELNSCDDEKFIARTTEI